MIQTIVTYACPKCGSENLVRNGHDYKGDQKYHCKTCESYGTLHAQPGYDEHLRTQVKRAVLERISLRGIERLFGISRRRCVVFCAQKSSSTVGWGGLVPPHAADCRLLHRRPQ